MANAAHKTIVSICLLFLAAPLHAQFSLSEAQGYNLISFGDFTGVNSDIEGGAAIQGNATLTSYSINSSLSSLPSDASLVVGGNLDYSGGQVFAGDVHVGGSLTNSPSVPDGSIYTGSTPFDFTTTYTSLASKSASYASYSPTGTAVNNYGTLSINANDPISNVFELTVAELNSINTLNINNAAGQVLINVVGTSGTDSLDMSYMGMSVTSPESILFNLIDVESFNLQGITFGGSILGVNTDLTFNNGNINGQVLANSFSGTGELHARFFTGNESVPEPSTYGIIGATLLSLLVIRRRFRMNKPEHF